MQIYKDSSLACDFWHQIHVQGEETSRLMQDSWFSGEVRARRNLEFTAELMKIPMNLHLLRPSPSRNWRREERDERLEREVRSQREREQQQMKKSALPSFYRPANRTGPIPFIPGRLIQGLISWINPVVPVRPDLLGLGLGFFLLVLLHFCYFFCYSHHAFLLFEPLFVLIFS